MSFFLTAAGLLGKLGISLGSRLLGEKIKDVRTGRRMARLVEDAVDRIVEQTDEYLTAEKISDTRKEILISALYAKLQPLVDDPQRFFAADLNGAFLFKQCHPDGKLPQEIREERLDQFYTVLFPQIAHFLSGSSVALKQWQTEGFREGFKRLSQLAEEIRSMNAKVADVPAGIVTALDDRESLEAETMLREFAQTLLNNLLLKLDLSPLRAERSLYGSLAEHFVIPAIQSRRDEARPIGDESAILEALAKKGARCVLHGGAGVGKTTCALWLQSCILQSEPTRLAIVIRLRQTVKIEDCSLLDLLREQAGSHLKDAITDTLLRKWNASGRLVLLFDGFDEVPEERRDKLEKWLKELAIIAKATAIVITSRPLQSRHLESLSKPWLQWDLLPFDEPRIIDFINRWHRFLPESELSASERNVDSTALATAFFADPSLRPLADTPLMLGTLLFVHHRDKKLPSGRVDLYERYISAMLGLRDSGLGIEARATRLTDREKRRVLGHVALHFHLNSLNEVNDSVMAHLVEDALNKFNLDEDADRLLPALRERTGLLQGPGSWSFSHKTIGEFLVAELIYDGTTRLPDSRRLDRTELWRHRYEDSWTAVLFFWAGRTAARELEEFIAALLEEETGDGTLLALSLLYDQGDRLPQEAHRNFALRVIARPWPIATTEEPGWSSPAPTVPEFAYSCYHAGATDLRGLTSADTVNAFKRLFSREIIGIEDFAVCHESLCAGFTMAAIWRLELVNFSYMALARTVLDHVHVNNLALYFFLSTTRHILSRKDATVRDFEGALSEWLKAYPEGKAWVPFLLVGCASMLSSPYWHDFESAKRLVGPLLFKWRDEPIEDDWVRNSYRWKTWIHHESHDALAEIELELRSVGPPAWGLSAEQQATLCGWCSELLEQRKRLCQRDGGRSATA